MNTKKTQKTTSAPANKTSTKEKDKDMNKNAKPTSQPQGQDTNIADPSKTKDLDELKSSINKRYEDIEQNFYLIGLDLIKVNMYVKNFRKWVKENTEMSVSMAYTLMRLVKRDKELSGNEKYKEIKPKVSLYKLIKLLKYPAEFVDTLDFGKLYDVPGGKQFNLLDMPRELFAEVIDHEFRMQKAKDGGLDTEFEGVPVDEVLIAKAKEKLNRMLSELQNIVTVLSEVKVTNDSAETVTKTIEELESINSQAQHINEVASGLLESLKTGRSTNSQSNEKAA